MAFFFFFLEALATRVPIATRIQCIFHFSNSKIIPICHVWNCVTFWQSWLKCLFIQHLPWTLTLLYPSVCLVLYQTLVAANKHTYSMELANLQAEFERVELMQLNDSTAETNSCFSQGTGSRSDSSLLPGLLTRSHLLACGKPPTPPPPISSALVRSILRLGNPRIWSGSAPGPGNRVGWANQWCRSS